MTQSYPGSPLLVITGPTASGKTGLALAVAEKFGGTIINSDSMQVYRELRVLTARPSAAEETRAPHKLYGILPATERYSAGRWREMAVQEIEAVWRAKRLPIVVGGTGLYIKALLSGLSELPGVPEDIRSAARATYCAIGAGALHARLASVDPEAAARLPETDTQRILRAYEIYLATGKSLSDWHREASVTEPLSADVQTVLLEPPREDLYARCNDRFDRMMARGALDEVAALVARVLDPSLPAMKALGVPELAAYLAGTMTRKAAEEKAKQATRNFAKRQMTWFRNQIEKPDVILAQYSERNREEIFSKICF